MRLSCSLSMVKAGILLASSLLTVTVVTGAGERFARSPQVILISPGWRQARSALMREGYNFDGIQPPPVSRLGDATTGNPYSVPNFYGAHGHNSTLHSRSAIFYAAGPSVRGGATIASGSQSGHRADDPRSSASHPYPWTGVR